MKVKAKNGFSGLFSTGEPFSMYAGEVRDVEENDTVNELLAIGYLEPAEAVQLAKAAEVQPEVEAQATDGVQPEKAEEAEEPKTDEVKHENKRSRAKPD